MSTPRRPPEILHLVAAPAPEADPVPPLVLNLDEMDSPGDVIDLMALRPFATGAQPWSRAARLDRVRADALLRPADARVVRVAREVSREAILAEGEGWTLLANRWKAGNAQVTVSAISDELAESVLAEAVQDAAAPPKTDGPDIEMGFWHLGQHGANRTARTISADPWKQIRENYTAPVAAALDKIMDLGRDDVSGRLLLLHGPPGTGKTTALRALARAWSPWCQSDCVLDPEMLFGTPGYLMEVAVGEDDDDEDKPRWRLLILEDCDELIRGEAKQSTGQGLSRLLNLTDGMLGQGRNVLVAITTNEDLARMHPAVIRPGRCLAQVEIGRLTHEESVGWLGDAAEGADIGPDGATLAELVALRKGEEPASTQTNTATGFYL